MYGEIGWHGFGTGQPSDTSVHFLNGNQRLYDAPGLPLTALWDLRATLTVPLLFHGCRGWGTLSSASDNGVETAIHRCRTGVAPA